MRKSKKLSLSTLSLEMIERSAGIEEYISSAPGIGGKIKEIEDDFLVEEILDVNLEESGTHLVVRVTKKNWDTMNFARVLSSYLHISRNAIGYAGTKDKKAISVQYFSIPMKNENIPSRIQNARIKDAEIEVAGYLNRKIKLGDLLGNRFRIAVRSVSRPESLQKTLYELESKGIPNFFGIQRFGTLRFITHEVGKLILMRNYSEAFWVYVAKPSELEDDEIRKVREDMWHERDPKIGLRELPKYLIYERNLLQKLREGKSELQALISLPKNLKLMFIHAYQSYVFNRILSERIREFGTLKILEKGDYADFLKRKKGYSVNSGDFVEINENNFRRVNYLIENKYAFLALPVPGYETKLKGWSGEKLREVLEMEGLNLENFRGEHPEFSSRGSFRTAEIPFDFENFLIESYDNSILFNFFLPKGCFATSFLREIMKSDYSYFLQK